MNFLLVMSILLHIGSISSRLPLDKNVTVDNAKCWFYPLKNDIYAGQEAKFILFLPKSDNDSVKWALYFLNGNRPTYQGELFKTSKIRDIELAFPSEGTYSVILFLLNNNSEPTSLLSAEIRVIPNRISIWMERISGPLLGAIIAILVFVIQDIIRNKSQKRKERNRLRLRLSREIDKLSVWNGSPYEMPELPNWMFDTSDPFWSIHIQSQPFIQVIADLENIHSAAIVGTINQKKFKSELKAIKKKLKET